MHLTFKFMIWTVLLSSGFVHGLRAQIPSKDTGWCTDRSGNKVRCSGGGGSGGGRARPTTKTDLEKGRAAQEQAAMEQAADLKGAGFASMQQGDYTRALPQFQQALKILLPYEKSANNTLIWDVRDYISEAEAHIAEQKGDLDGAVRALDRLCPKHACAALVLSEYYDELERRRDARNHLREMRPSTDRLLDDVARKAELQSFLQKKAETDRQLDSVLGKYRVTPDGCRGDNSPLCQAQRAASTSAEAAKFPPLTGMTPPGVGNKEGGPDRAGPCFDGSPGCQNGVVATNVPKINGTVSAAHAARVKELLAKDKQYQPLVQRRAELKKQIQQMDTKLDEIKRQLAAGGDPQSLGIERSRVMNSETHLFSEVGTVEIQMQDRERLVSNQVGFEEEQLGARPPTRSLAEPPAPKKKNDTAGKAGAPKGNQ